MISNKTEGPIDKLTKQTMQIITVYVSKLTLEARMHTLFGIAGPFQPPVHIHNDKSVKH